MNRLLSSFVSAGGVVALLALTACSDAPPAQADDRPISEQLVDFLSVADFAPVPYRTAIEATPTSEIVIDGVVQRPPSDLLVAGKVTAVEPGRSFSWPGGPQISGQPSTRVEHDFNAPEAWISTVTVELAIERSSYADKRYADLQVVRFGLSLHSPIDVDAIRSELMSAERVVALLVANEFTAFDLDPELFGVLGYGEFLGFVDKEGRVEFGASPLGTEPDGVPVPVTLDDLFNPNPKVVNIRTVDGVFQYIDG